MSLYTNVNSLKYAVQVLLQTMQGYDNYIKYKDTSVEEKDLFWCVPLRHQVCQIH